MNKVLVVLSDVSVVLWVGGLWIVGFLVAPLLFSSLPDNHSLAGALAGKMFKGIAWVGVACATLLLLNEFLNAGWGAFKRLAFWLVLLMLTITLIMQFWLQPFITALRAVGAPVDTLAAPTVMRNFAFWHGISSMLYVLESALGFALVLKSR